MSDSVRDSRSRRFIGAWSVEARAISNSVLSETRQEPRRSPTATVSNKLLSIAICVCAAFLKAALSASPALAVGLDLGTAANYALIDVPTTATQTTFTLNTGPITGGTSGGVLLGNAVDVSASGGNNGAVPNGVFYDSTVTNIGKFGQLQTPPTTTCVSTSVTQSALASANSVSAYAAALTPTQTFGNITTTTTIIGAGGLNVIDLTSIHNAALTLSGSANSIFVINVSDYYATNQPMTLSGVTANHVLFNLTGPGTGNGGMSLQTSGGAILYGTFLNTGGGQINLDNVSVTGAIINTSKANVTMVSGSQIDFQAFSASPN
jgi:hypothetical protein